MKALKAIEGAEGTEGGAVKAAADGSRKNAIFVVQLVRPNVLCGWFERMDQEGNKDYRANRSNHLEILG